MPQVAATGAKILDISTTLKELATPRQIAPGETYYLLITSTTAASTTQTLQGVALGAKDQ